MNLLIVEDEIETINGIMKAVCWDNLRFDSVDWATSIESATEKYEANQPDVILCDIELPDGSGLDFLEWVGGFQKTLCIIMTCHEKFTYAQRAISIPRCREYIVKPIIYEELEEKLMNIIQEIDQSQENDRYQAFGREWVRQISQEQGEQEGNLPKDELITQVQSYIRANLREEIKLESIAKRFFMSADYLSRVFKKETGMGFRDFITEERMFLAKELLKEGRLSVARVAYECGYDNFSYFTKVFKKVYGMSPREYTQLPNQE